VIAREKLEHALLALNAVLVRARVMAFEHAPHQEIAKVLDVAELLPMLILESGDATARFRGQLEGLVEMDQGFKFALQRFEGD
jgi:hypothetical protein